MKQSWRKSIAHCLPSLVAAAYMFLMTTDSIWMRVLSAVGGALLVPVAGMLAVLSGYHLYAKVRGGVEELDRLDFKSLHFVGGVLACTLVWVWLQFAHQQSLRKLTECAEIEMQNGVRSVREAIKTCREYEQKDESNEP